MKIVTYNDAPPDVMKRLIGVLEQIRGQAELARRPREGGDPYPRMSEFVARWVPAFAGTTGYVR